MLLLHPLLAWRDQAASPGEDLHLTWANHLYVDRRIGLYWSLPYKRLLFSATGENTYTSTYSYNLALYIIFVKRKILKLINFFFCLLFKSRCIKFIPQWEKFTWATHCCTTIRAEFRWIILLKSTIRTGKINISSVSNCIPLGFNYLR